MKILWTTKPLGGGVKSLVVRPLKKHFFMCVFPKQSQLLYSKEKWNRYKLALGGGGVVCTRT